MTLSKKDQAKAKTLYNKMVDVPYEPPARLEVKAKDLPEIKNWDVGKTYDITLKAKMISKSEGGYDGTQPLSAVFHVSGAKNDADYEDD
ncbi:MAG TPA: hypothetical protein VFL85_01565 [Candidatus Saccharimonadales bacterium]|nr:hypothetical protein [Candidatus Saccharimonadales bacterium]